ncbi:MAG: 16S rRNA (uracil(1498)-N(3))-methyltransferase [Bacteroidetes bacterium]|nr:16S rRNA (uracil(1498)-N(3))-methyltransferase [Bacteroidota bacterium]
MNLPFFYEEQINQPTHILSEDTSRHCVQVLRMKINDQLHITDGKGNLATATIIDSEKKHCSVKIASTHFFQHDTPEITIAASLLKNPSRFEWFLEKATEIGVKEIIPLICDHTEKTSFRFDRMQHVLISAMLQSRQTWLPVLHRPKKFKTFVDETFDGVKMIAHCDDEEKKAIAEIKRNHQKILIVIGPEGDFSKYEIQLALQSGFIPVTLGNTRLRSETAGIVAVTLINHL